jgi:hypothetical protein
MTVGYQNYTIANVGIPEINRMEYSPGEMEGMHHDRRDARRARSMPPHNRGRTGTKDPHTSLPEPDPVTGYGEIVAVDEAGPIYEYPNFEVSLRGGAGAGKH